MGGRSQLEGYRIFGKPRPYLRSLALRDALFCEPGQARDGAALSRIACALRIRVEKRSGDCHWCGFSRAGAPARFRKLLK